MTVGHPSRGSAFGVSERAARWSYAARYVRHDARQVSSGRVFLDYCRVGHPTPAAGDCRSGASSALDFTTLKTCFALHPRLNSRTGSATRCRRSVQDGQGGEQSTSRRRSVGSTHVDIAARLFQPAPQTDPLAKCWLSVTTSRLSSTVRHAAGGVLIVKCLLAAALSLVAALDSNGSPRAFPQVDETATHPIPRHRASFAVNLRGTDCARADERRLLSGIVG